MGSIELQKTVAQLQECKKLLQEAEAEKARLEGLVKAELTARNAQEVFAGPFKITYKPQTRMLFDQKAFSAAMPELFAQFKKPSITTALRIS